MVTRSKLVFICYGAGVIFLFGFIGHYLSADQKGNVPLLIEWIEMPGALFAVFCLVGVHSDYFIFTSTLANIGVYLLIPYLLRIMFAFWKK